MKVRRAGILFLWLHAIVAVFSLAGTWGLYNLPQVPDWDYTALTFWLGISNIATGVLAALLLMASREGWKPALTLLALCMVLAGGMELLGTTTGIPFGEYSYTDLLGPKFLGHVPYLIPPSWMMMLYPAMVLTQVLMPQGWLRPALAGLLLTVWDFAMDPAMTTGFAYWQWHTEGGFYGMPWVNWFGWWLTGTLVAAAFWKVSAWRGEWEPAAFALYLIQGAFMAGLAWLYMRPLASLLWLASAGVVTVLVWRRLRARSTSPEEVLAWHTSS
ncbi:MAG: carotenoid biosynthesis protein [Armatimonadota bacterium]|nr:carotenoid biosynthesis protein [Armatimonadota bacterium]